MSFHRVLLDSGTLSSSFAMVLKGRKGKLLSFLIREGRMLIECEFLRSRNWYSAVFILLNYSNPILRRAKFLRFVLRARLCGEAICDGSMAAAVARLQ